MTKTQWLDDERTLGRYTVVILHQTNKGHWSPSVMQLDTTVTNFRLVLRPFRKKYHPATIPSRYIKHVELTQAGRYNCVVLKLITGNLLYLMLSTGKLDDLRDDLNAMTTPPPRFQFDETVAKRDIERLITFFGRIQPASNNPA